jgi:serine/threonine protein kinase/predicted Zn-dependent protease
VEILAMNTDHASNDSRLEQLAREFLERRQCGEQPSIEEYAARHPDLATDIRTRFPTLLAREKTEDHSGSASQPAPVMASRQVGDYRILREIGRGGMGVVYEAEQESLGRRVALKVLSPNAGLDEQALERFRREARAAARLHHTNIVPVFEVGRDGDLCFYAMQFIAGQSLEAFIRTMRRERAPSPADPASLEATRPETPPAPLGGTEAYTPPVVPAHPIPLRDAASTSTSTGAEGHEYFRTVSRFAVQAAQGLAHAHARGVVHRDIKPSNLILDAAGVVWITDFGLARTEDDGLTQAGAFVGTLRYMAPERFRGQGDGRVDVYALGLTLYELLLLRPAFEETDRVALIEQVRNEEPPRPRDLDSRVPRDLETIVLKAIEKEPSRRYQTADELAGDLQRFLDDRPILARRVGALERGWRWARRNPIVAGLSGFVALLLVVVAVAATVTAFRMSDLARKESAARETVQQQKQEIEEDLSRLHRVGGLLESGQRYEVQGEWDRALAAYNEAVKLRPDQSQVWAARGRLFLRLGLLDEAADDLAESFRARAPSDLALWFFHACLRLQRGDTEGYRAVCAAMLDHFKDADDETTARWLVRTCTLGPGAVGNADRLTTLGAAANDASALQAMLFRAGRVQQAANVPVTSRPEHSLAGASALSALTALRLGKSDQAKTSVQDARLRLGHLGLSIVQQPFAPEYGERVAGIQPALRGDALADWLADLLLFREAAGELREGADHALPWLLRARGCAVLDCREAAHAALDRAVKVQPDDPWLLLERARFHAAWERWPRAEEELRRALELAGLRNNPGPRLEAATLYARRQQWDEAAAWLYRFQPEAELLALARVESGRMNWDLAAGYYGRILAGARQGFRPPGAFPFGGDPFSPRVPFGGSPPYDYAAMRAVVRIPCGRSNLSPRLFEKLEDEVAAQPEVFERLVTVPPQLGAAPREELWVARCRLLVQRSEWDQAVAVACRALDGKPPMFTSELHAEIARWPQLFERMVKKRPSDIHLWLARGNRQAHEGHFDQAAADFHHALTLIPEGPEAVQQRTSVYNAATSLEQVFKRLAELRPKDGELWLHRAQQHSGPQATERAAADLAEALRRAPQDFDVLLRVARTCSNQGKPAVALSYYQRLLEERPDNAALRMECARLCAQNQEWEKAATQFLAGLDRTLPGAAQPSRFEFLQAILERKEIFERAVAQRPRDTELWLARARKFAQANALPDAIKDVESALERARDNPEVWLLLAGFHRQAKALDRAVAAYQTALKHTPAGPLFRPHDVHFRIANDREIFDRIGDPHRVDPRLWLARVRSFQNNNWYVFVPWPKDGMWRPEEVRTALDQLLRLAPDNPVVHLERSRFFAADSVKDWEQSANELSRALDLTPTEPPWTADEDYVRFMAAASPPAVFDRVTANRSEDAWLWVRRAWYLNASPGAAAATPEAAFAAALDSRPTDPALLFERASYHAGFGRWDLAAADVRAARGSRTFDASAFQQFATAAYLAAAGDLVESRAASAEAIQRSRETKNAGDGHFLALSGLLLPDGPGARQELLELAEKARAADMRSVPFHFGLALAHYRAGNFEKVARLAEEFQRLPYTSNSDRAVLLLLQGMAHIKVPGPGQGWKDLRQAFQMISATSGFDSSQARVLAVVLQREAKELLPETAEASFEFVTREWTEADVAAVLRTKPLNLPLLLHVAQTYRSQGKSEAALALYDRLVRERPDDLSLRLEIGKTCAQFGAWDDAVTHCFAVLDRLPTTVVKPPTRYEVLHFLVVRKELFERATAQRPRDADLWLARARLSVFPDRISAAMQDVQEALNRAPKNHEAWAFLASLHLQSRSLDRAVDAYESALENAPDGPVFRPLPIHEMVARNGEVFPRIVARRRDDVRLWLARVQLVPGYHPQTFMPWPNHDGGREEDLRTALDHVVRLAPDEPLAYLMRGRFYASDRVKEWNHAVRDLDRALDLTPSEPPWIGDHWTVRFVVANAPPVLFNRLMANRSEDAWLWVHRAQHLRYAPGGSLEAAEAAFATALSTRPDDPTILMWRANFYAGQGLWDRAAADARAFRAGLQLDSDAFLWLATTAYLAAAGDVKESRAVAAEMFQRFGDTKDPRIAQLVALASVTLPDGPVARERFVALARQAHDADANDPQNVFTLALTRYRAGDFPAAVKLVDDFLRDPGLAPAAAAYRNVLLLVEGMAQVKSGEVERGEQRLGPVLENPIAVGSLSLRAVVEVLRREAKEMLAETKRQK